MGPSDVVYVEKRRGPRTDTWGTPVTWGWGTQFGYLPSPDHLERPTSEIGFKPAKWNPSDVQWWESGQDDLMVNSVKSSRQIQQNEDWWFGISFCNQWASVTERSAVSVEWPLLKPNWLASSLLFCERNNDNWLKTTHLSVLATNGRREIDL